jgi:hypothetical protein
MKKQVLLIAALFGAALLAACGGGGGSSIFGASTDLAISADRTQGPVMAQAISGETFAFSAVPDFGTQVTTTVTVAATSTTPTFSIVSLNQTASGPLDFGSCIFRITASTFPAGSALAVGQVITISRCRLTVRTRGTPADGAAYERAGTLTLNNVDSTDTSITVTVNSSGQVTLNGKPAGTVPVADLTGG